MHSAPRLGSAFARQSLVSVTRMLLWAFVIIGILVSGVLMVLAALLHDEQERMAYDEILRSEDD